MQLLNYYGVYGGGGIQYGGGGDGLWKVSRGSSNASRRHLSSSLTYEEV